MNETLIDGRYQLLDVIGSGGEARVFRARDTTTGGEVAARLALQPTTYTPPKILPAFHPGWVKFLDSGIDSHQGAYQIFEFLQGMTLQTRIESGPLDVESWRLFVDQSLDAVEALHMTGWIHGDLNAQNFLLVTSESCWKLVELPFLRFDPPSDRSSLFGSIYTLAPEQFNGLPADVRSDLYALGCLYYYAAAGEFPHAAATSQEIAISRLRFTPVPLTEKAPDLPGLWSTWVMTLLASDAQNRFPTVSAARQLLEVA